DEARVFLAESAEIASASDLPHDWLIEPTWVFLEIVEGRGDEAKARAAAVVGRLDLGAHNQGLAWSQLHLLAAALHEADVTDAAVRLHSACARWHAQRGVSHERIMFPRLYARFWGGLDTALASAEYEASAREGRELDLEAAVALGLAAAATVAEGE